MKYLFLLALIVSCQKNIPVEVSPNSIKLMPESLTITQTKIMDWRVGTLGRYSVSKGLQIHFDLPLIDDDTLGLLVDQYRVDSWIVRVRKQSLTNTQTLGSFSIPFLVPGTSSISSMRRRQIKAGAFAIYYTAAAVSKRFETFHCPAFNHNLEISEYDLSSGKNQPFPFIIGRGTEVSISGPVGPFSYEPYVFNGGKALVGEYEIEIALYQAERKRALSNFVSFPQLIRIKKESLATIRGCEDFEIPTRSESENNVEKFKFGR